MILQIVTSTLNFVPKKIGLPSFNHFTSHLAEGSFNSNRASLNLSSKQIKLPSNHKRTSLTLEQIQYTRKQRANLNTQIRQKP